MKIKKTGGLVLISLLALSLASAAGIAGYVVVL